MPTKVEQLKQINAQKKELAEKQKALREELDATKEQRKEARKVQAQARKDVREQKAELRDLSAKVYEVFSSNDPEAVGKLADSIMEAASELAGTIRKFGDAAKDPEAEAEEL